MNAPTSHLQPEPTTGLVELSVVRGLTWSPHDRWDAATVSVEGHLSTGEVVEVDRRDFRTADRRQVGEALALLSRGEVVAVAPQFPSRARTQAPLARARLEGLTVAQTSEALAADAAISDFRAERIVRTEQSFAMHRRQIEDARALDLGLRKQLVAVRDDRTGEDSLRVDGQIREIDEPFFDGVRHYMHPPNRPNDRETVVFVP